MSSTPTERSDPEDNCRYRRGKDKENEKADNNVNKVSDEVTNGHDKKDDQEMNGDDGIVPDLTDLSDNNTDNPGEIVKLVEISYQKQSVRIIPTTICSNQKHSDPETF